MAAALDRHAQASTVGCVDALTGLLDGPRAQGAFLLRSVLDPPWSMRIADEAPLTLVAVVRGQAHVVPDAGAPVRLATGDVALVRGPEPYTVADEPGTPPQVVVLPGQRCASPGGGEPVPLTDLGVRTWGTSPQGGTVLLTGTYQLPGEVGRRLVTALPPLLAQPADASSAPLLRHLAEEIAQDRPGQEAVLDRLLDLLLITVLRAWLARPEARAPGWYRAAGDPVVGRALRLLEDDPARAWTVDGLGAAVGLSRAALARRFTALVGEPPMTYLTHWRLALAADMLAEPGATLAGIADRVGYSTPYALSAAFRRVHGRSPAQYRLDA